MKIEQKTNYHLLFIMGIIFTGSGIAIGMMPMMGLGLCLMAIGLAKRDYLDLEFDTFLLGTMRQVKSAFDPQLRFNPVKLLPPMQ